MGNLQKEDELIVLLSGAIAGTVKQSRSNGLYTFSYNQSWLESSDKYPLSLSMPLSDTVYNDPVVRSFLWGLLPDNARILKSWGLRFGVSDQNPFALLKYVGEDCAGAVQFVSKKKADTFLMAQVGDILWLTEHELGNRLRLLQETKGTATRVASDTGQFSLPGAQPKIALFQDSKTERWGVPSGVIPTTHIVKPPLNDFDGFVENEHLSLCLARAVGLPAAESFVLHADGEIAIVIKRFDRYWNGGTVSRIHQEDFCQALSVSPFIKYENQGGPGIVDITTAIRTNSSKAKQDEETFLDAIIFSWIIANTDAHAKNYSILISNHQQVRLSPLYDLGSALPYEQTLDPRRIKLAMRIGKEYKIEKIALSNWFKLADGLHLDRNHVEIRIKKILESIPDSVSSVWKQARDSKLTHPIVKILQQKILDNTKKLQKLVTA